MHMISSTTEEPEAAWQLLAFLSSDDYQRGLCAAGLWLPSLHIGLRQQGEPMGAQGLWSHTLQRRQPLTDVGHTRRHVSLHSERPPPQHAPLLEAQRKALGVREGHQRVGACIRDCDVPAELRERGGKEFH